MKKEYIDELLNRFLLGETSEQEEQSLAEFFRSAQRVPEGWTSVPTEWTEFAAMFRAFEIGEPSFSAEEMEEFAALKAGKFAAPETMKGRKQRLEIVRRWAAAAVALVLLGFAWQWRPREEERAGIQLQQTGEEQTKAEPYAKAHDNSTQEADCPHEESWGYRQNRGSATLATPGKANLMAKAKSAASTTTSVTFPSPAERGNRRGATYEAKRSVGSAKTKETSVRSGVRLHQTGEEWTEADSHSKAVYAMMRDDSDEEELWMLERGNLEEEFRKYKTEMKTVQL